MRPQSQLKANSSSGFLWVWLFRLWTVCATIGLFLFMRVCFLEDVVVAALSLYVYGPTGLLLGHMASCSGFSFENHVCSPDWWHQFTFLPAVPQVLLCTAFSVFSVRCLCFCGTGVACVALSVPSSDWSLLLVSVWGCLRVSKLLASSCFFLFWDDGVTA